MESGCVCQYLTYPESCLMAGNYYGRSPPYFESSIVCGQLNFKLFKCFLVPSSSKTQTLFFMGLVVCWRSYTFYQVNSLFIWRTDWCRGLVCLNPRLFIKCYRWFDVVLHPPITHNKSSHPFVFHNIRAVQCLYTSCQRYNPEKLLQPTRIRTMVIITC